MPARALLERVLEARRRVLGGKHPDTTVAAWNLLHTLVEAQETDAAIAVIRASLAWLLTGTGESLTANQRTVRSYVEQLLRRSK